MKRWIIRIPATLVLPVPLLSCGVTTTQYVGNSSPATTAPELYFDRADVSRPYVTTGYVEATRVFKAAEAQSAIEQKAREKGADAIVFGRPEQEVGDPTVSTTVSEGQDLQGNRIRTISAAQPSPRTNKLHATSHKCKS